MTQARLSIALADDDPVVRRSLQLLLRAGDYDVRAYSDGDMMLADPGIRQSVCIIADMRMPRLDGLELMRQLRHDGWEGFAILITGYPAADTAARAAEAGFDRVLAKPLADRQLLEAVRLGLVERPIA